MLKGIDTIIYIHMFKEYSLCHIKVLSVYQLLYTCSTDLMDVRTCGATLIGTEGGTEVEWLDGYSREITVVRLPF